MTISWKYQAMDEILITFYVVISPLNGLEK